MSEMALAYVPVVGFLAWRARRGGAMDWVYFSVNVLLLWFSALWFVGYPLLIVTALSAAAFTLTALVFSTSTDMFNWRFLRRR